jgi:S1-C subfamily serine protease
MDDHSDQTAVVAARRRRTRRVRAGAAAVLVVGAVVVVHEAATSQPASGAELARPQWSGASADWSRAGSPGSAGSAGVATGRVTTATDAQQAGVVDIDVLLGGSRRAAGTGMVLTADGEVLTNRHVVAGETAMRVTVTATGRTYPAHVVGLSTDTDVAVVQIDGAPTLDTVKTASRAVALGDRVVGVGNAGGTGGTPSAAPGQVTGLGRSITATAEDGSDPEDLTGLIETDAPIQPGDSGGPLLDASDEVVGMDTAGSTEEGEGFAIPIAAALEAAEQIESGQGASGQDQAQPGHAYLGVELMDGSAGAQVAAVVAGSPAARAGLDAGDTITSIAGRRVGSVADVASVLAALAPGQVVDVTFVSPDGSPQSSSTTVTAAPAA